MLSFSGVSVIERCETGLRSWLNKCKLFFKKQVLSGHPYFMDNSSETLDIILHCASIPSFSSYEERLHPYIEELVSLVHGAEMVVIPNNNVLIKIPGKPGHKPVALSAHLDKINHYGETHFESLEANHKDDFLQGLLDDAAGLGICLHVMLKSMHHSFPPLYLFLSEMEESYGIRNHPGWLKDNGKDRYHGMGAERIAVHTMEKEIPPDLVITVDTTPLFRGDKGVALYANHWELNNMKPFDNMVKSTMDAVGEFMSIDPDLMISNNTNDYLVYGRFLNRGWTRPVPSLALEPAIFPYHEKKERVYVDDIYRVENILTTFLEKRIR